MKMPVIFRRCPSMLLFLWLALFSVQAQALAAIDNAGILDNVLAHYSDLSGRTTLARTTWGFHVTTVYDKKT